MLWNATGRKKQVPDRGRIFTHGQELRRLELANAQLAVGSLNGDTSSEGMIVKRIAHDATHASRGRDFRTLVFPDFCAIRHESGSHSRFRYRQRL